MKKLVLHAEHLGELTTEDLRRVAGARGGAQGQSDTSCLCTLTSQCPVLIDVGGSVTTCHCSEGSCGCLCNPSDPCR